MNILHNNPPPQNIPKLSCQKIFNSLPMEDFVKIDDNTIIASGVNLRIYILIFLYIILDIS
jgi:hypothetical protein